MRILSLMSGSSLDGTDIGVIEIIPSGESYEWNIHWAETISLPSKKLNICSAVLT